MTVGPPVLSDASSNLGPDLYLSRVLHHLATKQVLGLRFDLRLSNIPSEFMTGEVITAYC